MKKVNKYVYWIPRILSILFIMFLAMFSLDIFDGNYGFWGTILGLFMHNIPTFILIAILAVSWKYEVVGGIGYCLAGLLYTTLVIIGMFGGFEWHYLGWIAIIAGPAFIIGILFLVGWFQKRSKKR